MLTGGKLQKQNKLIAVLSKRKKKNGLMSEPEFCGFMTNKLITTEKRKGSGEKRKACDT